MKKNCIYMVLMAALSLCLTTACTDDDETKTTEVAFSLLSANGSATETTTALTLSFNPQIEGLTADDITLTAGETAATKGALTKKASGEYELAMSGIAKGGEITVAIGKEGYIVTPDSKKVTVYYVKPAIQTQFKSLTANGSVKETTTALTITLNADIEGLTADDITLTAGETAATKGTLTAKGAGVYELAVSGITKSGEVTIAISKAGYALTPASLKAMVYCYQPVLITNKALFTAIEEATGKTFTKDADGNVDVDANQETINSIIELDLYFKKLPSLAGIEYFTKLTNLDCSSNSLATLDVSKNIALTTLDCSSNKLTVLDVTKNVGLTTLNCNSNELTALDVTKNIELVKLSCNANKLSSIDLSNNVKLEILGLQSNQLTAIDISKNTALTLFLCSVNQLKTLDVSKNTALTELACNHNQLTALDVTKLSADIFNSMYKMVCGGQTSNGTTEQNLTLTVTQAQRNKIGSPWINFVNNKNVTLKVAN